MRFSPESSESLGVRREGIRQHLQGIVPLERRVMRPPDLAHAAFANQGGDFMRRCTRCASQLALGLQPVIEVVAMFASPREIQVVGATGDFIMRYLRGCCCPLLR